MLSIFDHSPLAPINFNNVWNAARLYMGRWNEFRHKGFWTLWDVETKEFYGVHTPPSPKPVIEALKEVRLIYGVDCDCDKQQLAGQPINIVVNTVHFSYMLTIEIRKGIQPYKMFFIAGPDIWKWLREEFTSIMETLLKNPYAKQVPIDVNYAEYDYEWFTYQLREHFTFDDQRPEREVIDVYNIDTTDAAGWSVFPCAVPMYSLDLFNKEPLVEMITKGYLELDGEWDSVIKPVYGSEDNAKDYPFDWQEATKDYYPFCVDTRGY